MYDIRISWNPILVRDFDYYLIKRNGVLVGKSKSETFLDRNTPAGTHTYTVVAVDLHENHSADSDPFIRTSPPVSTPPSNPTFLRFVLDKDNNVKLHWDYDQLQKPVSFEIWVDRPLAAYEAIAVTSSQSHSYYEPIPVGVAYKFRVRTLNEFGVPSILFSNEVVVTASATPSAPELSLIQNYNVIELNWTTPVSEDLPAYFLVERQDTTFKRIGKATAYSIKDGPLPSGTYAYRIASVSFAGAVSPYSNVVTSSPFVSPTTAPSDPTFLRYILDKDNNIRLYWDYEQDQKPVSFEIWVERPSAPYALIASSNNQMHNYFEPVPANTAYKFKVKTVNAAGLASGFSNEVTVTTDPAPGTPELTGVLGSDGNRPRLQWTTLQTQTAPAYFLLFRRKSPAAFRMLSKTGAQSHQEPPLAAGDYDYYVVSVSESGHVSPGSNIVPLTVIVGGTSIPDVPTNLRWRLTGDNDIALFWSYPGPKNPDTGFEVWLRIGGGPEVRIDGTNSTSYTYRKPDFSTGHDYFFRVTAVSKYNISSTHSSTVTATRGPAPSAPVFSGKLIQATGKIVFGWTYPSTEPKPEYYLVRRRLGGGSFHTIAKTTAQGFQDTPLSTGQYGYQLIAVSPTGQESTSSILTFDAVDGSTITATHEVMDFNNVKLKWMLSANARNNFSKVLVHRVVGTTQFLVYQGAGFEFTDKEVPAGSYTYHIVGFDQWDTRFTFTTVAVVVSDPPNPPWVTGARNFFKGDGLDVVWDEADNEFLDHYAIFVSVAGGPYNLVDKSKSTSILHRMLSSGPSYGYRIVTYNKFGLPSIGAVPIGAQTSRTIDAPIQPRGLIYEYGTSDIKFSWVAEDEIRRKNYELIRNNLTWGPSIAGTAPLTEERFHFVNDPALVFRNLTGTIRLRALGSRGTVIMAPAIYNTWFGNFAIAYTDGAPYFLKMGFYPYRDQTAIVTDRLAISDYIEVENDATTMTIRFKRTGSETVVSFPYTPGYHVLRIEWSAPQTIEIKLDGATVYLVSSSNVPIIPLIPVFGCTWKPAGTLSYLVVWSLSCTGANYPTIMAEPKSPSASVDPGFIGGTWYVRSVHEVGESITSNAIRMADAILWRMWQGEIDWVENERTANVFWTDNGRTKLPIKKYEVLQKVYPEQDWYEYVGDGFHLQSAGPGKRNSSVPLLFWFWKDRSTLYTAVNATSYGSFASWSNQRNKAAQVAALPTPELLMSPSKFLSYATAWNLTWTWNRLAYLDGPIWFTISRSTDGGATWSSYGYEFGNSFETGRIAGIPSGTVVQFRVRMTNSKLQNSAWSNVVQFTMP